jgi:hypothetical protein
MVRARRPRPYRVRLTFAIWFTLPSAKFLAPTGEKNSFAAAQHHP